MTLRIGLGVDTHPLVEGRRLVLGGVEIPFERGLIGHSDADCLVHAVMDAILGALGEGDIGEYFPDLDERYRDASSIGMLMEVGSMIARQRYSLVNVDAVILAERPRLAVYRDQMCANIAGALAVEADQVHVKATTTEGLDAVGRGEGITCHAVVLLERS